MPPLNIIAKFYGKSGSTCVTFCNYFCVPRGKKKNP